MPAPSRIRLQFAGLPELKAALKLLPDYLAQDAQAIVFHAVDTAARDIRNEYAEGDTGNLRRGVHVSKGTGGQHGQHYTLKSNAKHAWLYEFGSALRKTRTGASRGRMPAGHVFIKHADKQRRIMYTQLIAMMRGHGLRVTGNVAA